MPSQDNRVEPWKVRELREKTGLPILVCRRALQETAGDLEMAKTKLREEWTNRRKIIGSDLLA